jgi:hypothetical protein
VVHYGSNQFELVTSSLNCEPDHWFSSAKWMNLELNLWFSSNHSSEPNFAITMVRSFVNLRARWYVLGCQSFHRLVKLFFWFGNGKKTSTNQVHSFQGL